MEVLDLTSRPDVNLRDIERAIERDQAMTARVLQTINSASTGSAGGAEASGRPSPSSVSTPSRASCSVQLVKIADGGGRNEVSFDFINYCRSFLCASAAACSPPRSRVP